MYEQCGYTVDKVNQKYLIVWLSGYNILNIKFMM